MTKIKRHDVTMAKAIRKGRMSGRGVFIAIPVSRAQAINGLDALVAIITDYTDYFDNVDNLVECVDGWLADGYITVVSDGVIMWAA